MQRAEWCVLTPRALFPAHTPDGVGLDVGVLLVRAGRRLRGDELGEGGQQALDAHAPRLDELPRQQRCNGRAGEKERKRVVRPRQEQKEPPRARDDAHAVPAERERTHRGRCASRAQSRERPSFGGLVGVSGEKGTTEKLDQSLSKEEAA